MYEILYIIDLVGTAVFAISGALAAGRKHLDFFGVLIIGVVTSCGGGTLRDLLLGATPVFWMQNVIYLAIALGASWLTIMFANVIDRKSVG